MAKGRVSVSIGQPHIGLAKQRAAAEDRAPSQYRSLLLRDSPAGSPPAASRRPPPPDKGM